MVRKNMQHTSWVGVGPIKLFVVPCKRPPLVALYKPSTQVMISVTQTSVKLESNL